MEFSPRLKLLVLILFLAFLILAMYYSLLGLFHALLAEQTLVVRQVLSVLTVVVLTGIIMVAFWENLPEYYDDFEEDIVQELTLHNESAIFRVSLIGSLLFWLVLGIIWRCHWPFFLGIILFGTTSFLYLVEIATAIYIHGLDGIQECFSDTIHSSIPNFWLLTLVVWIGWVALSLGMYSELCYQPIHVPTSSSPLSPTPPATEHELNIWEKLQQKIQEWQKNEPSKK